MRAAIPPPDGLRSVLIVDGDLRFLEDCVRIYPSRGIAVRTASGPREALAHVREAVPDLALVDIHLGGVSGFDLLAELYSVAEHLLIIAYTSDPSPEAQVRALRAHADWFLLKGFDVDQIIETHALLRRGRMAPGLSFEDGAIHTMELTEWLQVRRAMKVAGGNASQAARLLGMGRTSIYRNLRKRKPLR